MFRLIAVLLSVLMIVPAYGAKFNDFALAISNNGVTPPIGVGWSTLPTPPVPDAVLNANGTITKDNGSPATDNTAALNALPTNETLYCDVQPAANHFYWYSGEWLLNSHLKIYLQNCPLLSSFAIGSKVNNVAGAIDQGDLITSGTYNSTSGLVTLNMNNSIGYPSGSAIVVSGLTGTGALSSISGQFTNPTVSGSTITYVATKNLGTLTITGGAVTSSFVTTGSHCTPLTNVFIDGLNIRKPILNGNFTSYFGRMMRVYINSFTLSNFNIGIVNGFLESHGSDWNIGPGNVNASTQGGAHGGNPGIKTQGNTLQNVLTPEVLVPTQGQPTNPATGTVANLWFHDISGVSDDAFMQLAPEQIGSDCAANLTAENVLIENINGVSPFAEGLLFASSISHTNGAFTNTISDVTVRGTASRPTFFSGGGSSAGIINESNTLSFENITIGPFVTFDGLNQVPQNQSCTPPVNCIYSNLVHVNSLPGTDPSQTAIIDGLTFNGVTIQNAANRSLIVGGGKRGGTPGGTITNFIFENGTIGAPRLKSQNTNVVNYQNITMTLIGTNNTNGGTISNNTIAATPLNGATFGNDAFKIGGSPNGSGGSNQVMGLTITGNTITGVTNNQDGINLQDVDHATITNNVITGGSGSNGIGMSLAQSGTNPNPGTTNTTVTGNNVSGVATGIICAAGQGNTVPTNSNTGFPAGCP